jgi:hypothetical protein
LRDGVSFAAGVGEMEGEAAVVWFGFRIEGRLGIGKKRERRDG